MVTDDHQGAPLLTASGVVKHFPGAKALDGVDLDVYPGEVHCLLGQNGAGKSTLIKVLAGAHRPDAGVITWQGQEVSFPTPVAALRAGIATMYQELDVVDGLTVAENIFLGNEVSAGGFIQRTSAHARTREVLQRLGHANIAPGTEVESLSAAGKQVVSMARALSHDAKLIIMDEPSAVLDSEEVANLFRVVRDLVANGIAVIYISHRLEEIRQIGDRLTVLKDGKTVASGLRVSDTTTSQVVAMMTGHEGTLDFPPRTAEVSDEVVLSVRDLALDGVFRDVSFDVHAGEIVGLAGLVGSGRSEILETVYGARRATSGEVRVSGVPVGRGNVAASVAKGMGFCPEERKSQGLLLDESVTRNITLSIFARLARLGFVDDAAELGIAREQVGRLGIVPARPEREARTLSGGNQQKILLGRWLAHGTKVLFLDEPTRGVDVGARAEAYQLIRELAATGVAIVIVSSELEEVVGLADRVLVISDGRVVHAAPAAEIDEHQILDLIVEGTPA
ncbi:sugar ABC transporter ATP-binding protein [Propionicimonas sp. T2.31MG-18]|uniref:sugar ABC transporter ATP-binding protein n=1 Tax=Propionicimonas sp. T2.31MG-18 TaxID=3157620 RepID=UPI00366F97E9